MPGVPRDVRENLENFDDLDFRVYSGQLWDAVHLSHSDDIVVHLPDGTSTTLMPAPMESRCIEPAVGFGWWRAALAEFGAIWRDSTASSRDR